MNHAVGVNQIALDESERKELHALLLRNASLRQARDLLQARLFQNGITLATPATVTDAFAEILNKYYVPFARGVFDDYLAFGYSHYFLRTVVIGTGKNRRKICVPTQLQFGTYDVHMQVHAFKQPELDFTSNVNRSPKFDMLHMVRTQTSTGSSSSKRAKGNPGPRIYPIVFDPNILPDVHTARHNSVIASLIKGFKYTEVMSRFSLQAEYLRANPKLITQPKPTTGSTASKDIDPDSIVDSELIKIKEKQRNNMKLNSMESMVKCQGGGVGARRYIRVDDDVVQLTDLTENIFHLPYDVELASNSVTQAGAPSNLLDLRLQNARVTLQVLGIPASLVAGRDVAMKNNSGGTLNENDRKMFLKSLEGYKRTMEQALQEPYDRIYRGEDTAEANLEFVEIPLQNDSLSMETLALLAEHEAITDEEKKKYMLINAGLAELIR